MVNLITRGIREKQYPELRFLSEKEQAEYEEACKSYGEKARQSLGVPLEGSHVFKVLKLNDMGIKTASLFDLGIASENGLDLRNFYENPPAIVLRSAGDSYEKNDYIAKSLAKLIKKRSFPHTLVIEGLKLVEDSNSHYGLSLEKGKNFRFIETPDFDWANHRRRFNKVNPNYTIDFDDNGKRILSTRDNGVSVLGLVRDLVLIAGGGDLVDSDEHGRVVVVSGEVTKENLEQYASFN